MSLVLQLKGKLFFKKGNQMIEGKLRTEKKLIKVYDNMVYGLKSDIFKKSFTFTSFTM